MTLDAQDRGVFSLDITATDQAEPENTRKSSTVRVRNKFTSFYCLKKDMTVKTYMNDTLVLCSLSPQKGIHDKGCTKSRMLKNDL